LLKILSQSDIDCFDPSFSLTDIAVELFFLIAGFEVYNLLKTRKPSRS
jgi:hypothetical protein